MKKETINTFSDGMSLDLNPLGTPAKTLTNCLNGTLITYNGNELTLQNDMGNVPIGTAALPKGYVPVGMKEHGGIIYVASYNPETGKGLLGCFPSPLQIYVSEAAQTIVNINILDEFIDLINNKPFIKRNEYREEIFKDSITQEPKVFNSGDIFIVKVLDNLSELFRLAIDEKVIELKLYVIPTSGREIIDVSSELKLYEDLTEHNDIWIFLNGGSIYNDIEESMPFDEIINEYPLYLLSYPRNIGPGILELVIEFNTFKLFNLYNNIQRINNSFDVLFIGVGDADIPILSLIPMTLIGNIGNKHKHYSLFEELNNSYNYTTLKASSKKYELKENKTLYYDILPASKWGVADLTFLKSGELSYADIINYQDKILRWNFEINNTEAIIKWSFIHLNNETKIDYMRLVCIPLDYVLDNNNNGILKSKIDSMFTNINLEEASKYVYEIHKPYYSGDFEDVLPIDDDHLSKNYIYLCRLDIIYEGGTTINAIDYKLLYTGTFFNDKNVNNYNYNNRPNVSIELDTKVEQLQELTSLDYTLLKEENNSIKTLDKLEIQANDIMFLADDNLTNTLIGVVKNINYKVDSTLSVKSKNIAIYNDKKYNVSKSFAGNVDEEEVLNSFSTQDKILFTIKSETKYNYNEIGDELIETCKKDYIEQEQVNNINVSSNPILAFTKNSLGKYTNTSQIKVHRGILSRLSQPEDRNVVHQGLYPVYEPEDREYNNLLFGFRLSDEEDDYIYGCILWKILSISNYGNEIGMYGKDDNDYPYSENATVLGNTKFINKSTEFDKDTLLKTIANMGNKPINICISTQEQNIFDKFDISENPFLFQLTMPHEISFNESAKTGKVRSKHDMSEHAEKFKKNNLGYNSWTNQQAFHRPEYTTNCMTITWRTQYGHRLINVATPLDIANESTEAELMTIERKLGYSDRFNIYTDNKKHALSNMHLRAEKLLLCMLSLILIAKCKNSTLKLNAPDILYQTDLFTNKLSLNLNKTNNISLILNGKNIETALSVLLQNNTLNASDIYIPKFNTSITLLELSVRDTLSNSNLMRIFEGYDYPYFSSVTEEQLLNIYPGQITSIEKQYLCNLETNKDGTYKINTSLLQDGKFYKIFLPVLMSESNDVNKKFNCKNTAIYKFMLEGFAYNDILLPMTKIAAMQDMKISKLESLDSDNPQYNLLYYNAFTRLEHEGGAITLFGDLSAVINTGNFNNNSSFPVPKLGTDTWKEVDIFNQQETDDLTIEPEQPESTS